MRLIRLPWGALGASWGSPGGSCGVSWGALACSGGSLSALGVSCGVSWGGLACSGGSLCGSLGCFGGLMGCPGWPLASAWLHLWQNEAKLEANNTKMNKECIKMQRKWDECEHVTGYGRDM